MEVGCVILNYGNYALKRLLLKIIIFNCQEGTPTRYEGNSVDEALAQGLADLNVRREQVDVQVLEQGKKGFLGIGKQLAAVELTVKPPVSASQQVQPQKTVQPKKAEPAAKKPVDSEAKTVADKPETEARSVAQRQVPAEKPAAAQHEEQGFEEVLVDLGNYLAEVTKNMGITVTINVTPEKHTVYYDFETEQEGLLIGKRGKNLNSLQLLAQDFLDKHVRRRVRVILDVADYRERRAETLAHLAQKTARDAIAAGKPLTLDPMPALERKVIHKSLADNSHVETYSRGNEPHRAVVIAPNS